ncbi:dienelactone hydrolase family protein [Propylenella binzhouense]|uniref:Alpha/beta hydrolase n=1 Tax=Propylenella binzhouense TaxID=2555902 RepID=A0A964T459_9HYPH|nr:dienelactone hydrolase family protein [Propylenella binzhouense]MYZ47994.1 alpha/beta hydrolase [Propylenella binzhouense]
MTERREVAIGTKGLPGSLAVPADARGLVIFVHGSGSGRRSPRNRWVAERLVGAGLGTLLFDLLTEAEGEDRANVFDIPLLGVRTEEAVAFAAADPGLAPLPVGLFGASTGAAAALVAAANVPDRVAAVVSRGGRPDLAAPRLARVKAPTLLIVGGEDDVVIDLNREALAMLTCERELAIVAGATHLFEEPGALDEVCDLSVAWFRRHLARSLA